MRPTAPSANTTEAAPLGTAPDPSVAAPALEDSALHRGTDAARELSGRTRVRHDHAGHGNHGIHGEHGKGRVAPGAMRFARKMVHLVRDEMRDMVGDEDALTADQRDALKQAGKDLRRDVRDAAARFTRDDGSLDLAGFFGALGDSVKSFAEKVGGIVTPAPQEEPVDDSGLSGPVAPTRSDDPLPALDPTTPAS